MGHFPWLCYITRGYHKHHFEHCHLESLPHVQANPDLFITDSVIFHRLKSCEFHIVDSSSTIPIIICNIVCPIDSGQRKNKNHQQIDDFWTVIHHLYPFI